jgi:hypothetical protein
MNAYTSYLYDHLRKIVSKKLYPADLEIDEVTTYTSPSTGTSPFTEKYSDFYEASGAMDPNETPGKLKLTVRAR